MSSLVWLGAPAAAGALLLGMGTLQCMRATKTKVASDADTTEKRPAWRLFCVSNVLAVAVFAASVSYIADFYVKQAGLVTAATLARQPLLLASAGGLALSALYMLAFFGVAFIAGDVEAELAAEVAVAAEKASKAAPAPLPPTTAAKLYDADVCIVGAGTAGAALATVLARRGQRVVLIERSMHMIDRIVGELMQPGGIRALERMGLSDCAKSADVDSVVVDGYACVQPGTSSASDLILTYPPHDPGSLSEFVGMIGSKDERKVTRHGEGSTSGVRAGAGISNDDDRAPKGRSFHNHRFVQELRKAAVAERNAKVHVGKVTCLLYGSDLASKGYLSAHRTSRRPAPEFSGFDCRGTPVSGGDCSRTQASTVLDESVKGDASELSAWAAVAGDRVSGVKWLDETGVERVTTARLTVVADGMYSVMRNQLNDSQVKPRTISHFCGLLLHHPPHAPPLPYPNRGHVILANPNPVLLYQISATETRVLVDVPEGSADLQNGTLTQYFVENIAPQLPEEARPAFLEACRTQEPMTCANKQLTATPTQKNGAVLVGDSWNMRHPLTGGGMTVALKDIEMMANCITQLNLAEASPAAVDAAIAVFQRKRSAHASTINILANALYKVFSRPSSDDGTRERLRAACIDYMSMGGVFAAGPIGLLSGLTPKPAVLVSHFFAVALHAMKLALLPLPTPTRLRQGYDLLHVACMIIMPLIKLEQVTLLSWAPVLALIDTMFPWSNTDFVKL